jgi:2'-5' RNA ligase
VVQGVTAGVRLFVAVMPPPPVIDVLAELPRPEAPGLRWTGPDQWHVTLRFLGQAEPDEAVAALDALSAWPAVAGLGPVTALLGNRLVMVPVAGLDEVAAAVVGVTAEVGRSPEDRPFVGHLTLARSKGPVPPGSVGAPVGGSFPVGEVCLVRSQTLPEGARYDVLERFALG